MSEIPTSMKLTALAYQGRVSIWMDDEDKGWEASLKVKGRRKIHVVSGTIEWAIARLHAEMLARG
jgi:hypothetical protein